MRKSIIYCDRCGRELQQTERSYMLTTFIYAEDRETAEDVLDGAELCEGCFGVVDQATATAIQGAKEEPKGEPKRKTIKLDFGKVKALHEAGWNGQEIAKEMKVSAPTISKALKKIYAEVSEGE